MKKPFYLLTILIGAISMTSCVKEDEDGTFTVGKKECEKSEFGYTTITNSTDDDYYLYVDAVYKTTIASNIVLVEYQMSSGFHVVKLVQKNGYFWSPEEKEYRITVKDCETGFISFSD